MYVRLELNRETLVQGRKTICDCTSSSKKETPLLIRVSHVSMSATPTKFQHANLLERMKMDYLDIQEFIQRVGMETQRYKGILNQSQKKKPRFQRQPKPHKSLEYWQQNYPA